MEAVKGGFLEGTLSPRGKVGSLCPPKILPSLRAQFGPSSKIPYLPG